MSWRLARSLERLGGEIQAIAPGTTVWDIGDEAHQQTWSDHNPNECCDVVCAVDVLDDAGLDLRWFVNTITATDPPALKYVIYQDRIWFPQTGWQPYHGNWHSHVHVSVGWGPDGRSTGPYDDISPWGLAPTAGGIMALPRKGDRVDEVEVIQRMLVALGFDTIDPDNPEHDPDWRYDGDYGDLTEAAVLAFRKSLNPDLSSGARVTPWTFYRLVRAVGALDGGDGEDGKDGEDGRDATPEQIAAAVSAWMDDHRDELRGEPGKTPTKIKLSMIGDVVEVE